MLGEQIFKKVNDQRKARGEPELTFFRERSDPSDGPGESSRRPRTFRQGKASDRAAPFSKDTRSRDKKDRSQGSVEGAQGGRGELRRSNRRRKKKIDGISAKPFAIQLEERMAQIREEKLTPEYSRSFNPSEAAAQGQNEVDYELAHVFPEPKVDETDMLHIALNNPDADAKVFTIASRDGTIKPGRKTNRHHDKPPEEGMVYLDISDIGGGVGERTFYAPPLSKINDLQSKINEMKESLENIVEATDTRGFTREIEAHLDQERNTTDIHELMEIKDELESGLSTKERMISSKERAIRKMEKEYEKLSKEGTNSGQWLNFVPLPVAHKPETSHLDDYVPPKFTHESFKYLVPALPFGSQGRLAAAMETSMTLTDSLVPSDMTPEKIADFQNAQSGEQLEKSFDELKKILGESSVTEMDDRPIPTFNKRKKVPNIPKSSDRPGEVFDINREMQIEDIYSDTQLAIWREMNKGAFAPKGLNFNPSRDEDEELTEAQVMEEAIVPERYNRAIQDMSAASLLTFRRRDEFEIRDIRRRLGLPMVNGTYMEEPYYKKTSLDGIFS
jgi:hypothetical protein